MALPKLETPPAVELDEISDDDFLQASFRNYSARQKGVISAEIDEAAAALCLHLVSGVTLNVPLDQCEDLAGVPIEQLRKIEISPARTGIYFPLVDVDLYVPGLIDGIFGSQRWMQRLGQAGGSVKSEAKAAAARENGKRGGRPKKTPKVDAS